MSATVSWSPVVAAGSFWVIDPPPTVELIVPDEILGGTPIDC
ncbi:hypothetical protein [Actinoalloteichus hymeniacidonis]|nr:hypothetical protein [Actinoalloteichus hymeniacidonis]